MSCDISKDQKEQNIIPPKRVVKFFENYNKQWSNGNVETIVNDIYDLPMSLYAQDSIHTWKSDDQVRGFLSSTFNNLELNNYGFSVINKWENYREDKKYIIIEMNFTRFFKDSTIMGDKFRKATYILRKTPTSAATPLKSKFLSFTLLTYRKRCGQ
jgi:hypothetical protein